jgi:hypothetical protein
VAHPEISASFWARPRRIPDVILPKHESLAVMQTRREGS